MKASVPRRFFARMDLIAGLTLLPLLTGCEPSSSLPPDPLYILVVTSMENAAGYETDPTVMTVGGGNIGGEVEIFINGKLFKTWRMGGTLQSINHWLHAGTNEIKLIGDHDIPLYVKVCQVRSDHFSKTGEMDKILEYLEISPTESSAKIEFDIPPVIMNRSVDMPPTRACSSFLPVSWLVIITRLWKVRSVLAMAMACLEITSLELSHGRRSICVLACLFH